MNFDWQAVAAPAIVCAAIAYLTRLFCRKWFRSGKAGDAAGCGSCGSCPSSQTVGRTEPTVVQIGTMLEK